MSRIVKKFLVEYGIKNKFDTLNIYGDKITRMSKKIILNITEFRELKKIQGVVIVTSPILITMHKTTCSYLQERNFIRKSDSKSKKGVYVWFSDKETPLKEFENVKNCSYCNPFEEGLKFKI